MHVFVTAYLVYIYISKLFVYMDVNVPVMCVGIDNNIQLKYVI